MQKAIQLAQNISKRLDKNWLPELEEINLHTLFSPIYKMNDANLEKMNIIISFIICAYDNDSSWINIKQDRYDNKIRILKSLHADTEDKLFISVAMNENSVVNDVIAEYTTEQIDWRWQTVFSLLDYHSKMIRYGNRNTDERMKWQEMSKEGNAVDLYKEYDATTVTKINREKGDLLVKAIEARATADKLLVEMRKEYVSADHAVQQDFSFSITDEKKIDPMSWKQFIQRKNEKMKAV